MAPWSAKDVAIAVAVAVAATMLVVVVAVVLLRLLRLDVESAVAGVVIALATELVLLGIAWRIGVRKYRASWQALGWRRFAPSGWAWALGVLFAGLLVNGVYVGVVLWAGWADLMPPPLPSALKQAGLVGVATRFLVVGVTPLAEESFFRGLVFGGLVNRGGLAPATGLSAALFAFAHVHPAVIVPVFCLGLLLCGLYARTGSILPGIAVHAAYNALAIVVSFG